MTTLIGTPGLLATTMGSAAKKQHHSARSGPLEMTKERHAISMYRNETEDMCGLCVRAHTHTVELTCFLVSADAVDHHDYVSNSVSNL